MRQVVGAVFPWCLWHRWTVLAGTRPRSLRSIW